MIFEKGRHTNKEFFIYEQKPELVESFKYTNLSIVAKYRIVLT